MSLVGSEMFTPQTIPDEGSSEASSVLLLVIGGAIALLLILLIVALVVLGSSPQRNEERGIGGGGGGAGSGVSDGGGGSFGGGGGGKYASDFPDIVKWTEIPAKPYLSAKLPLKGVPPRSSEKLHADMHNIWCNFNPEETVTLKHASDFRMDHLLVAAQICTDIVYDNVEYKDKNKPMVMKKTAPHHGDFGLREVAGHVAYVGGTVLLKWLGVSQSPRHSDVVKDILTNEISHPKIEQGISNFIKGNPHGIVKGIIIAFDNNLLTQDQIKILAKFCQSVRQYNIDPTIGLLADASGLEQFKEIANVFLVHRILATFSQNTKLITLNVQNVYSTLNRAVCYGLMLSVPNDWSIDWTASEIYYKYDISSARYLLVRSASAAPTLIDVPEYNASITPQQARRTPLAEHCKAFPFGYQKGCCTKATKEGKLLAVPGNIVDLFKEWYHINGIYFQDILYDDYADKCATGFPFPILSSVRLQYEDLPQNRYSMDQNFLKSKGFLCNP